MQANNTATITSAEICVYGKSFQVPSARIRGREMIVRGRWIKTVMAKKEELVAEDIVDEPEAFLAELASSGLRADVLMFPQKIYESTPKFNYRFEWDNAAAINTEDYATWWNGLPQETRKNVRRAEKRGVTVRVVEFDDEFVRGIKEIFDESPIRQGRRFWHYGKDVERIKAEQGEDADRSEFLGAYCNGELIGFMKFTYVGRVAKIMQILAKTAHQDKRPINALIAKAVEVCNQKGISFFVYSKLWFGNKKNSQLADFKLRNGFVEMLYPRYYVPLTLKGRIWLALGLHRGLLGILPPYLIDTAWKLRAKWVERQARMAVEPAKAA